jgi:hypothetical protein
MHAVDFYNCSNGVFGINKGNPYCPNLVALGQIGINYVATASSMPSDSFPGLAAIVTGGSPKTTGLYYDVAYDRSLAPPGTTTGTGLAGGTCTPYAAPTGTTTDYDQGIELDDTKLNGDAPGAAVTEGTPPPSIRISWYGTRLRVARPCIRGTSSGRTRYLAWSMRRADTRPGSTSTRRIRLWRRHGPG